MANDINRLIDMMYEQINDAKSPALKPDLCVVNRDDLLDLFGDAALVGKPIGSDAENDKNTFASVYGPEKCEALIRELTDKALTHAEAFGEGAEVLKNLALWLTDRAY